MLYNTLKFAHIPVKYHFDRMFVMILFTLYIFLSDCWFCTIMTFDMVSIPVVVNAINMIRILLNVYGGVNGCASCSIVHSIDVYTILRFSVLLCLTASAHHRRYAFFSSIFLPFYIKHRFLDQLIVLACIASML